MPEMALTVITPSIRILQTLMSRRSLHLVGLGGDFSPTEEAFFGETASRTLREYAVDTLFSPARDWSAIAAYMRVRKPTPPC